MKNTKKERLSVAIATFNEEEHIGKCLESVKDLADEIVLVDGGSTDKTVEIAKKYGAGVFVTDNPPIFHINKQKAIDRCTGDWILQLDADEIISSELKNEIRHVTTTSDRGLQLNGFWIPRKNWFLGRFLMKGGQYPDYTLRLYRRGKGRLPQESVHEQAVVQGQVGYLKHPLLHYPYKNVSMYFEKWNRYNKLLADQIREELSKIGLIQKLCYIIGYLFIKPLIWFFMTYFRHKGFMDSWQGLVFSFFSALRFPVSYITYLMS